jgi:hypothetical protein
VLQPADSRGLVSYLQSSLTNACGPANGSAASCVCRSERIFLRHDTSCPRLALPWRGNLRGDLATVRRPHFLAVEWSSFSNSLRVFLSPTVPYGYTLGAGGKRLVENPSEQGELDRIRALRGAGMNLRAVSDRLNCEGLWTRSGGRWRHEFVLRAA